MKGLYLRNEIMTFAINYSFEDSILKKKINIWSRPSKVSQVDRNDWDA